MMHDYDNPNTCYAIGDSFGVYMGTAVESRQPASGVFEELSAIVKEGESDLLEVFDGSTAFRMIDWNTISGSQGDTTTTPGWSLYNMSHKFGNAVYIRKAGTAAKFHISGVQVDS